MSLRPALPAALLLLVLAPLSVPDGATAAGGPTCDGRAATIVAAPDDDVVHGTPGDDVIVGSSEGERIEGGPGNDVICAGDGWDKVFGGAGDDRIFDRGNIGRDVGGSGADRIVSSMRQNHQLGGRGDDVLIATGRTGVTWYAEPGDDTYRLEGNGLIGLYMVSDHSMLVDVPAGVIRGEGHNLLDVGSSVEVGISTGDGDDVVLGGPTSQHIRTGRGKDIVRGQGGDDFIEGGPGDDNRLYGGAGHDQLFSGAGDDLLDGGAGHDSGRGGSGDNTCVRIEHAGIGC